MKTIQQLVLAFAVSIPASAAAAQETVDTAGWLRDFAQLKAEMSSHYANLEWAVTARRMDLRVLSEQTERSLRSAPSDAAARAALQAFVNAFGDGHLEIRFPSAPSSSAATTNVSPSSVCARARYTQRAPRIRIPFDRLSQFRKIDNSDASYFPLGVLQLPNGKRVGVLRIATFEDNVFLDLCERAAHELAIAADSSCADGCAEALERATSNLITDALVRQVRVAQANDIAALLVDIAHNGGGTNWVEAAARVLTANQLKAPRMGFVRHPHHVQQFERKLETLRQDVKRSASHRDAVRAAMVTLAQAKEQAAQTCDRSPLWEAKPIDCSGLLTDPPLYATGVLSYATPEAFSNPTDCCVLFGPARYRYTEGAYRGKLLILIDRETASAAEYFAALLKDNNAAELFGEPTYGAGCGFTNGGIPTTLSFSRARVRMPDCVRFRADGSNEVDGVTPDVYVPWRIADSPFQRADKVYRVLTERIR
jgi:hypothetical protein